MLAVLAVESLLVDRCRHPGRRSSIALLGDVHPHRHRHRHRLRHVLPLPLRGGAVPRAEFAGGASRSRRRGAGRACSWAPSPPPGRFYVLTLTDFRGLQELGFIAGTAILFAWVAMMIVFPAALVIVDRRRARPRRCRRACGSRASTCPWWIGSPAIRAPCSSSPARSPRSRCGACARRAFRLQLAEPPGPRDRISGLGAPHPRVGPPLGTRRAGQRQLPGGAARQARRLRQAPQRLRSRLGPPPDSRATSPRSSRSSATLPGWSGPIRIGRPMPVEIKPLVTDLASLKRRLGIAAAEAPAGDAKSKLASMAAELARLVRKLQRTEPRGERADPQQPPRADLPRLPGRSSSACRPTSRRATIGLADVPPRSGGSSSAIGGTSCSRSIPPSTSGSARGRADSCTTSGRSTPR